MILTIAHALNPLLMIVLPLMLGLWLLRRFQLSWSLFGWGALTFISSQVLHIPFNRFLLIPWLDRLGFPERSAGLVAGALLLGLSAGLFEEIARYVFLRRWVMRARSWRSGLLYGAGHGGAEAILLGILVLYSFVQAIVLRNADLSQVLDAGQIALAQKQLQAYWTMSPSLALMGALERVFALMIQMSATLMVVTAVVWSERRWLVAAILWHTAVDSVGVYLMQRVNVYAAEIAIFIIAVLAAGLILLVRGSGLLRANIVETEPIMAPRSGSSRVPLRDNGERGREDIENSRYL